MGPGPGGREGRWEELDMHVRAATAADLTPHQIAEVLLHTAISCGVLAANSAFDHARRVLDSGGAEEYCPRERPGPQDGDTQ
ncbi:MAG: carboxymuconolactone decarboxylase family protein [Candidatus Dormibacteria bacterium]